jgi:5'-3' exonuclease
LSINALVDIMLPGRCVPDFVAAMSLLGNDFIPRSLTQTVRDDGIPKLLSLLEQTLWSRGESLVMRNGSISRVSLLALVSVWAQTEEKDVLHAANESRQIATRPAFGIQRATTPSERELCEWNAQPARWSALSTGLLQDGALRDEWQRTYRDVWRAAAPADFLAGIAWVWAYYCGRTVCQAWVLDSHLPPLWADVAETLRASILDAPTEGLSSPKVVWDVPLPDRVHLLAVLPADSVRRLLPDHHRFLAEHAYWWPTGWSLFDVGRTQLWECEAVLPLIPESVLRRVV